METRTVSRLGFYLPRHSGRVAFKPFFIGGRVSSSQGWGKYMAEVYRTCKFWRLYLHAYRGRNVRCMGFFSTCDLCGDWWEDSRTYRRSACNLLPETADGYSGPKGKRGCSCGNVSTLGKTLTFIYYVLFYILRYFLILMLNIDYNS